MTLICGLDASQQGREEMAEAQKSETCCRDVLSRFTSQTREFTFPLTDEFILLSFCAF